IVENHNHEQFSYDKETTQGLMQRVRLYTKPLLVCNPSLAAAMPPGSSYLLLDRDDRFKVVPNFLEFDLHKPVFVDFDFDAVFLDPHFSNVSPKDLAAALRTILGDRSTWTPLFVAYSSRRQAALKAAFSEFGLKKSNQVLNYNVVPDS
ncbi:hypothetical protein M885DRAFT_419993, partial [Pelagophyceae sp. CCMP2097]